VAQTAVVPVAAAQQMGLIPKAQLGFEGPLLVLLVLQMAQLVLHVIAVAVLVGREKHVGMAAMKIVSTELNNPVIFR
jgi:hypothetical protein